MIGRSLCPGISVIGALAVVSACGLVDPQRPTAQPDTILFGNLLEVGEVASGSDVRVVQLRVGVPRALSAAKETEGRPTPVVEKGTVAEVAVTRDTVVMLDDRPASLQLFNPGSEVVAVPVFGSTRMMGETTVVMEAQYLMDFATYRQWKLPGLGEDAAETPQQDDVSRINSSGVEHAPVPVAGGRALYFSAHLRPTAGTDPQWSGARREGLGNPETDGRVVERTFRSQRVSDGWTIPELVEFPGIGDESVVRVSWVDEDETTCLVTVRVEGQEPWVGLSRRARASTPWGPVERMEVVGEGDAADASYLAGSQSMVVFTSRRVGMVQSDLMLLNPSENPEPLPLEPRINTTGDEWGARVGPQGELYFNRGDRQLLLRAGEIAPVNLEGPSRLMVSEAAPTDDGRWLFLCLPRLRPMENDLDIYVAPIAEDGSFGAPVPVDEWGP